MEEFLFKEIKEKKNPYFYRVVSNIHGYLEYDTERQNLPLIICV